MEKFSVIIPTIWASEYTTPLLEELSKCEMVGEIILIDNTNHILYPGMGYDLPKVNLIKEGKNTYVNPAWNKGVSIAKYDYVTICNDDILFNPNEYFYYMSQSLNLLDAGFIGSHSQNYTEDKIEAAIEIYDNKTNTGGWGCLFTFNKLIWKPIPEQLKIWYGDNWIHGTNQNIFQLVGMNIKTKMSTSSDRMDVREVRDNDTIEWHKLLQR